jgi:hypothetical protein
MSKQSDGSDIYKRPGNWLTAEEICRPLVLTPIDLALRARSTVSYSIRKFKRELWTSLLQLAVLPIIGTFVGTQD